MSKISKILYATDLSETARAAMIWARSLADKYDADITIIHVIPQLYKDLDRFGSDRHGPSLNDERSKAVDIKKEEILSVCKERLKDLPNCQITLDNILVKAGQPVQEILSTIHRGNYDMVVMGTHGQGKISKLLLGSVARGVVDESKVPVLTIRLPVE
ncbi:MAG: universal stress protein [Desulfobulbaceae bacterium]|nr:universal stress protein [Desulfobulbaceae bacterium]